MVDILILFQDDGEDLATRIAWAAAERGYSVWGDPNHFRGAADEELAAAAKAARAVVLLWTPGLLKEAERRGEVFAKIETRRAASAVQQLGLELPPPWRDRPNENLAGAESDAAAIDSFVEHLARVAGSPAAVGGATAVDRLRAAEEDAAAWRAIRDIPAPEAFDAYLDRFGGKGLFYALGRKRRADAQAARQAMGEGGGATRNLLSPALWGAVGAVGAAMVFGLLTLVTGGDLRTLGGEPTEEALALQNAAEIGADLTRELNETRAALEAAEEALEMRNSAVARLEIALAEAEAGGGAASSSPQGGGAEAGAEVDAAITALRERLAEATRRRSQLEGELARREAALKAAERRLEVARSEIAVARRSAEAAEARAQAQTQDTASQAEMTEALAAAQAENRRANAILQAARLRIEALETERAARRRSVEAAPAGETARAAVQLATQDLATDAEPQNAPPPVSSPAAAPVPRVRPSR